MDKVVQQKLLAKVQVMQQQYRGKLPDRIQTISSRWHAAKSAPDDEKKQDDLYREVHSIAGSSGTFGLPQVGDTARHLLNAIKEWQAKGKKDEQKDIVEIEKRLDDLSSLIESLE